MEKNKILFVVNFLMFISFLAVIFSGYALDDNRSFSEIHSFSAGMLIFFVIVHLLMNFNWVIHGIKNIFKSS